MYITVDTIITAAIHPGSDQAKMLYYHALRRFMMGGAVKDTE